MTTPEWMRKYSYCKECGEQVPRAVAEYALRTFNQQICGPKCSDMKGDTDGRRLVHVQ